MVNQKPEIDLGDLREVATKATPGTWKLWGMTVMADQDGTSNYDTAVEVAQTFFRDEHGKPRTWDATHIANVDPPTVLALLDRLEAAEAKVARVEELCAWADDRDSVWSGILSPRRIREALAGEGS